MISVKSTQKKLPISSTSVKKLAHFLLKHFKVECDELAIHFVTKKRIAELHKEFFNDPTPTDCISFPIDEPKQKAGGFCHLGEIFICPEVASVYAKKHKIDPYRETTLYLVHGLLHLLGHDDQKPIERKKMRAEEKRCMVLIKKHNLEITC